MSLSRLIDYERLVAPAANHGVLVEPHGVPLRALLDAAAQARLDSVSLWHRTIGQFRADLRDKLGLHGPVITLGHQAEFYHPGVLVKLFAAVRWAKQAGGTALYLSADSDTPKSATLAVPERIAGRWERARIRLPAPDLLAPAEYHPRVPPAAWRVFFDTAAKQMPPSADSVLPTYAAAFCGREPQIEWVGATWRGVAAVSDALDLGPAAHVRMSELSETPAFRAFVLATAADAARFATAYNVALVNFRERHRVRNRARPAPELQHASDLVELPFWADQPGQPRRRLQVRPRTNALELLADEQVIGTVSRAPDDARLSEPLVPGWHIRPRALMLSAFMRLFVADVFIHGIGGAKYDEVTNELVRTVWGVEPPPIACVTATLRLPLDAAVVSPHDLGRARWRRRDFDYNPQRYSTQLAPRLLREHNELVHETVRLRRASPRDRRLRRAAFEALQDWRRRALAGQAAAAAKLERESEQLEQQWRQAQICNDREYFFALHSRAELLTLRDHVFSALT